MGEIFARPIPVTALPFTGERLTSEFGGQTEMEHLHRYMLARHLCRGRDVLDIASGEGYGAALLGQVAASVIGVEVAEDAVAHAAANYARANLCFRRGDACQIPLDDASVDVVVSFETIEHIDRQETFLAEVRRVLRPGGKMIVSTPDRDTYSPADRPANPYHVKELTREEFVTLLNQYFKHFTMFWQRTLVGSALLPGPEAGVIHETVCFERRGDAHFEMSTGYARPQYLVAVCSDIQPEPLPLSVYIDTSNINTREDQLKGMLAAEQDRARAAEAAAQDALRRATAAEAASQAEQVRAAAAEAAAQDALRRATTAEAASQAEQVRAAAAEAAAQDALRRATTAEAASQAEQVRAAAAEAAAQDALRRATTAEAASQAEQVRAAAAEAAAQDALRRATTAEAASQAEQVRAAAAEAAALRRATTAEAASQAEQVRAAAAEAAAQDALRRATTAEAASQAEQVRAAAAEAAAQDALRWATTAEALRREIDAFHRSTSWRLTSPLRALRRLVHTRNG